MQFALVKGFEATFVDGYSKIRNGVCLKTHITAPHVEIFPISNTEEDITNATTVRGLIMEKLYANNMHLETSKNKDTDKELFHVILSLRRAGGCANKGASGPPIVMECMVLGFKKEWNILYAIDSVSEKPATMRVTIDKIVAFSAKEKVYETFKSTDMTFWVNRYGRSTYSHHCNMIHHSFKDLTKLKHGFKSKVTITVEMHITSKLPKTIYDNTNQVNPENAKIGENLNVTIQSGATFNMYMNGFKNEEGKCTQYQLKVQQDDIHSSASKQWAAQRQRQHDYQPPSTRISSRHQDREKQPFLSSNSDKLQDVTTTTERRWPKIHLSHITQGLLILIFFSLLFYKIVN